MALKPMLAIADHVKIAGRYVRSVDILRDLQDPHALEGYVVTPSGRDALRRILHGLRSSSTQRAFRVTGPYGSGKSAFGLLLARAFLERHGRKGAAFRHVEKAEVAIALDQLPAYLPVVLNGRRTSFADALLQAVGAAALGRHHGFVSAVVSRAAAALQKKRSLGARDDAEVLELLSKYARDVSSARGGNGGVLVLVDEMGRFLEHAAINRGAEDPVIFQQLAELASGSQGTSIAVVALLHHRFADYVAGFGASAEAEWTRSAERYEDVPLSETTEQTTFLLAQALEHSTTSTKLTGARARELYRQASSHELFATALADLVQVAPSLYPLHPAVVACLSHFAKRFGQNERSIFGFLQSLEPFGFQRFIQHNNCAAETWYRLTDLFDYIAAQGTIRPQSPVRERRWELLLNGIAETERSSKIDLNVLKCAGLLAVFEPVQGLKADASTIAWCLDHRPKEVQHSLERLTERNLLYRRPHRDDYCLWANTSVDLDGWLEEATVRVAPMKRLGDVLATFAKCRPLVAHRHYHRTGNLRAFDVRFWDGESDLLPLHPTECDGSLLVVPVHPDQKVDQVAQAVARVAIGAAPTTLFCLRKVTPSDLIAAREVQIWRWVEANCKELRADDLARKEVQARLANARDRLRSRLAPFIDPTITGTETWIVSGRKHKFSNSAALSQKLSELCDQVYDKAPILKNELINRAKLSSAVASARMRLLELIVEDPGREYLGLQGAPPERTIYLSLFHAAKMHRKISGRWRFAPPQPDPLHWKPVWQAIEVFLETRGSCSFEELLAHLAKPPYGLRAGPTLLVVAAFMTHRQGEVALMERNSFQPVVTGAHFQRLAKSPAHFSLRYLKRTQISRGLLEALSADLILWGDREKPEPAVKPIVEAIYSWWNTLPTYALETGQISEWARSIRAALKKASEPIRFLFHDLPLACDMGGLTDAGAGEFDISRFVEILNAGLQEIADAEPRLRAQIQEALLDAFGANSLSALRSQIRVDYEPHRHQLTEYRLRAFIDRADSREMSDDKWLDSIASLLSGRRLDGWEDTTLNQFHFEIRVVAQRMVRWLALARTQIASSTPLVSIHVVALTGQEQTVVIRRDDRSKSRADKVKRLREILGTSLDAAEVLGHLVADYFNAPTSKERSDG